MAPQRPTYPLRTAVTPTSASFSLSPVLSAWAGPEWAPGGQGKRAAPSGVRALWGGPWQASGPRNPLPQPHRPPFLFCLRARWGTPQLGDLSKPRAEPSCPASPHGAPQAGGGVEALPGLSPDDSGDSPRKQVWHPTGWTAAEQPPELPRPAKGQPSSLSLHRAALREHSAGGTRPAGRRPVLRPWAACCVPRPAGLGVALSTGVAVGTHSHHWPQGRPCPSGQQWAHTRVAGLRAVPAQGTTHSMRTGG